MQDTKFHDDHNPHYNGEYAGFGRDLIHAYMLSLVQLTSNSDDLTHEDVTFPTMGLSQDE